MTEIDSGANELLVRGYTKTQWLIFVVLGLVNLFAGFVYSIQSPLYPKEAESKGASASAYGFVLGVYELVNFLFAPLFGSNIDRIGPLTVFHLGVLLTAATTIAFGFLHFIKDGVLFIVLSFLIRIPQAIGGTAIITSSATIVTVEFSTAVATTFAAIETFFGFGFCTGPTIGSALFELGGSSFGFPLPFVVLGGVLFLSAPVSILLLCRHDMTVRTHELDFGANFKSGLLSLLKIPTILLYIFALFTTSIALGFLAALLEPHLRQFDLDPVVLGLMYLLYGGVYAVTAPIWGMLCDRMAQPKYITLAGAVFIFAAFICIGPAPFLPIAPKLWLTGLGLVIYGLGLGAIYVSSFILSLQCARENGFQNNLATYGLISGVWRSAVALGNFAGPSIAGILYDFWGFRNETWLILICEFILIVLVVVFLIREKPTTPQNQALANYYDDQVKVDENTPILSVAAESNGNGHNGLHHDPTIETPSINET